MNKFSLLWPLLIPAALSTETPSLPMSDACSTDGFCLPGASHAELWICASQRWQKMPSNGYSCVSESLTIANIQSRTQDWSQKAMSSIVATALTPTTSFAQTNVSAFDQPTQSYSSAESTSLAADKATVTTTYLDKPVKTRTTTLQGVQYTSRTTPGMDQYGIKSYVQNGKMASVYDASSDSTFRCQGVSYPDNGLYVAFWTQYEQSLACNGESQPAPVDCGDYVEFANPLTGKSAIALVLDRCASCVGVGNTLGDPTTSNDLINGATVDFSRALWNKIFENAPDNVYDIMYHGRPLQGASVNTTD